MRRRHAATRRCCCEVCARATEPALTIVINAACSCAHRRNFACGSRRRASVGVPAYRHPDGLALSRRWLSPAWDHLPYYEVGTYFSGGARSGREIPRGSSAVSSRRSRSTCSSTRVLAVLPCRLSPRPRCRVERGSVGSRCGAPPAEAGRARAAGGHRSPPLSRLAVGPGARRKNGSRLARRPPHAGGRRPGSGVGSVVSSLLLTGRRTVDRDLRISVRPTIDVVRLVVRLASRGRGAASVSQPRHPGRRLWCASLLVPRDD